MVYAPLDEKAGTAAQYRLHLPQRVLPSSLPEAMAIFAFFIVLTPHANPTRAKLMAPLVKRSISWQRKS
jgi:hypothetical protein